MELTAAAAVLVLPLHWGMANPPLENSIEMDDLLRRDRSQALPTNGKYYKPRQAAGFFTLGLLNNMMYVVILTAALELLPSHVPTGLLAFVNITPAVIAKAVFPYLLKGEIQYDKRVWTCTLLAFLGMMVIAMFNSLFIRLAGIATASFASGLGEITYLQYSTRFPDVLTTYCVGWFASGTGAAGLAGALAWWIVRPLGVKNGLSLLAFLSFGTAISFFLVLPRYGSMVTETAEDGALESLMHSENEEDAPNRSQEVTLSWDDKVALLKPLFFTYVLPLVCVYFAEYTINQGVAPTLLYPVPSPEKHHLLSLVIKTLRDYYPLYQLIYQTFVFLSRSYTSILPLPAIPKQWLWAPAVLQTALLLLLLSESMYSWFKASIARSLVMVMVAVEGLAGGSA